MKLIMLEILKRYSMALFFLLIIAFLMLIGTLGVKSFGDMMMKDMDVEMKPRGERIAL
ncbi:MAG: hypothetical protein NTZ60_03955 [Campylobacterales bacterium]|nr:hypothetical protein [Campylobacterales bacterium]